MPTLYAPATPANVRKRRKTGPATTHNAHNTIMLFLFIANTPHVVALDIHVQPVSAFSQQIPHFFSPPEGTCRDHSLPYVAAHTVDARTPCGRIEIAPQISWNCSEDRPSRRSGRCNRQRVSPPHRRPAAGSEELAAKTHPFEEFGEPGIDEHFSLRHRRVSAGAGRSPDRAIR